MSKTIYIKLTRAGSRTGPFDIYDIHGSLVDTDVTKGQLIDGITYVVEDDVNFITLISKGKCNGKCTNEVQIPVTTVYQSYITSIVYSNYDWASTWRHLTNPQIYNFYYNRIHPYIIEYPFSYQFQDEILQNVKDYTKAFEYLSSIRGVWDDTRKIEVDNKWFNKAILYNGQQSSGVLELVPKPKNNLSEYMKYPIYGTESKTIPYTKSDNFYQYNTFWGLVKDKSVPLFETSCCYSLSLDKQVYQPNMDYSKRSFKKEPLRAKDLKVRHILDNRHDINLVSQFVVTPAQISYK